MPEETQRNSEIAVASLENCKKIVRQIRLRLQELPPVANEADRGNRETLQGQVDVLEKFLIELDKDSAEVHLADSAQTPLFPPQVESCSTEIIRREEKSNAERLRERVARGGW